MEDIHKKHRFTIDEIERMARQDLMCVYIFIGILVVIGGIIGYVIGFNCGSSSTIKTITATKAIVEAAVNETEETIEVISETEPVETTVQETEPTIKEKPFLKYSCKALSASVTTETVAEVDTDELEMLACVIYQEAGGNRSCDDCRRYVADIVLNRVEHPKFPNTIESVLTAPNQYGRFHYTGIKWPERAEYDTEKDAVNRAYQIAREVLSGQHSQLYGQGYIWQAKFVQGSDGFWCCGHYYGK